MHIKIRWMLFKNRVRQVIFRLLLEMLKRVDSVELKRCLVGIKMGWNVQKVVPKDNKWHYVSMTVDTYIKRVKNTIKKKQSKEYYLDGVRVKQITKDL